MLNSEPRVVVGFSRARLESSVDSLEIRVDHARLKVTDGLQLRAIQMKAKADGITVDEFCKALSQETREYYRKKLFPTKFGPEKAYREESGSWRMSDPDEGSQSYTLKRVLETNLYVHTRAYLMGLIMSEHGQSRKGWEPETIILRDDDKVAIVKGGKLTLHSSDDWFRKLDKKKGKGARAVAGKRPIPSLAGTLTSEEKGELRSRIRKIRNESRRRLDRATRKMWSS